MSRTLATKKTKKKKKVKKRSMDSKDGSSSLPSSSKVSSSTAKESDASKTSEMTKKAQCDMCKLSYSTEKELTEHLLSIMHHTKMEDKEEKPVHNCTLCFITCSNMADYRLHVTTDAHQQKLSIFKGDGAKNPVNKKGKQPPWKKQKKYSQSKYGLFNGCKKQSNKTQNINKFRGIGFPSHSHYDNSRYSQDFRAGQWPGNTVFRYTPGAHGWPHEQFGNTRTMSETGHLGRLPEMNNIRNNDERIQSVNPYPRQWGSSGYDASRQYRSSGGISLPWKVDRRPQQWGMNLSNQKDHRRSEHSSSIDVDSSAMPEAWDEQSFLQHEQFLATMDDGFFIGYQYSSQLAPLNSHIETQRSSSVQDGGGFGDQPMHETFARTSRSVTVSPVIEFPRKQQGSYISAERNHKHTPTVPSVSVKVDQLMHDTVSRTSRSVTVSSVNEFPRKQQNSYISAERNHKHTPTVPSVSVKVDQLMHDTFAKTSRSVTVSPMKEFPRKQQTSYISAERNQKHTSTVQSLSVKSHTLKHSDRKSILERAESVSKELEEWKQKALHLEQRKGSQMSRKDVVLSPHEQQLLHHKGYPNNSGKMVGTSSASDQHSSISIPLTVKHSGISIPLTVKHSRKILTESSASAPKQNASVNALDDIRKSIEKSVLDKSKEPQKKSVTVSKSNRKRCSSDSTDPVLISDSRDVVTDKSQSKRVCLPQLSKDSIKKIVNAPNSRNERLQLSKMLQSRGEHKIAAPNILRTNVQLEGYGSVTVSEDASLGGNQKSSVQTIKLEDLSESVRCQILNLIGDDVVSLVGSQTELEVSNTTLENHTFREINDSNTHVILLSDEEDVINTSEMDKDKSQKSFDINTPGELAKNATKAKKRKLMIVTEPVLKSGLYRSALPSVNRALMSASSSVIYSDSHERTKSTDTLNKKQEGVLNAGSDINIPPCSSTELHRKKKHSGSKTSDESVKMQLEKGKASEVASVRKEGTLSCGRSELLVDKKDKLKDSVSGKGIQTSVKSPAMRPKDSLTHKRDADRKLKDSVSARVLQTSVKSLSIRNKDGLAHKPDNSSEISSSSLHFKQTQHEASGSTADAPMNSSSIHKNLKSSTQRTHTKVKSLSKSAAKSSTQVETVSSSLHTETRLSPLRSSFPDTGSKSSLPLTTQQQHSTETTLCLSSPNRTGSHTQTSNRLTLPPSQWLEGRVNLPEESLPSSSLNISASNNTSTVVTVITDDEDDNGAKRKQLPDTQVKDLPEASVQDRISSTVTSDDILMLSGSKPTLPISLFKSDDASKAVTTVIDDDDGDDNSGRGSEQLPDNELNNSTLPVSTSQADTVSTSDIGKDHSSSRLDLPPVVTTVKVECASNKVTAVTDDEDSSGAGDKQVPDRGMDIEDAVDIPAETSSNVMSELLILSEREEDIKQEKMTLDLRLSRLHKLLEQAVLQINQCTERRKQLHEEEQELSRQRLSLLREAAVHKKTSAEDPNIAESASKCDSETRPQISSTSQSVMQNLTSRSTGPCISFAQTSVVGSSTNENPQGASLSRDDWLAKFSSYLPCDRGEEDKSATVKSISLASGSTMKEVFHCSSIPAASLSSLLPSDALAKEGCSKQFPSGGTDQNLSEGATPLMLFPKNVTMAPVMYLRSIRSADAVVSENTPTGSLSE